MPKFPTAPLQSPQPSPKSAHSPCRAELPHDTTNSPSSSHPVLFRSILLTPTAIALSPSSRRPFFPTAHHSPRPNSSELRVPSWYVYFSRPDWLPSLPRQCVVEGRLCCSCPTPGACLIRTCTTAHRLASSSSRSILLRVLRHSPIGVPTFSVLGRCWAARSYGGAQLPCSRHLDANRLLPLPQSLVPSLLFRHQPVLHSQWVSAYKFLPRRATAVFGSNARINPGLGPTTTFISTTRPPARRVSVYRDPVDRPAHLPHRQSPVQHHWPFLGNAIAAGRELGPKQGRH